VLYVVCFVYFQTFFRKKWLPVMISHWLDCP